jgi:hypothetical protein
MHSKRFLNIILLLCITISGHNLSAQDTTWVQTFTFDSITTRRADFTFPESLDDQRFEKVLMYYKLKCSPLTTWDQYNCGEWDYLTYTRVFDHTGIFDSVRVDSVKYLHNYSHLVLMIMNLLVIAIKILRRYCNTNANLRGS